MSAQWYLYKDGWQQGPFSREELDQKAQSGAFGPADLVWTEGMENWTRADRVEGLFSAQPHPPAPSPVPPPSPASNYQPRGAAGHQAGPAPRSGKGGLVVLIVLLAVLFLGGGFLAFNIFLANGDDAALPAAEVESENGDSGQVTGPVDPAGADVSGLWAPPVEVFPILAEGLPSAGEVPYPLFPGAQATGYEEPTHLEGIGDTLAHIFLLTSEPMETVYAFYKDKLGHINGWQGKESPNIFVLWLGDDDDYKDTHTYLIPAVLIMEVMDSDLDLMSDAQSKIILVYEKN